MSKVLLFLVLTLISQNDAAKILGVFPLPSISHQVVFRSLTDSLVKRGHEVIVITTDPGYQKGEGPPNLREIDTHAISYKKWREVYKLTSTGSSDTMHPLRVAFEMVNEVFEAQLKMDEVQELLKKEKFDVLLLEACVESTLILSHIFNASVIQVSSLGSLSFNIETVGAAWHPLLYPHSVSQRLYNRSNWEKLLELWHFYRFNFQVMPALEEAENEMAKRLFGPNVPPISELKNNVDMLFLNIHPIWEENRPVPPNVIYMGGIHKKPVKELPKDLKSYLDSSKNGVVYMSLGTNVQPSLLPPEKVQIFVKVFSKLPYDVLWKWDRDELPGRTDNIKIAKWLPQSDLLRHPKIKVFITQGGLQSTDEAITAGVPLIGIPMLADQWFNTEKYVRHKIGAQLQMETLSEEELRNTIHTVINDESYRHNIGILRNRMRDEPWRPLERAVWWTEYVLRHGGARHLRAPTANMSWTQYLELELVFTVLVILLSLLLVFLLVVYQLWRILFSKSVSIKLKKKQL